MTPGEAAGLDQRATQADEVLEGLNLSLAEGAAVELVDDHAAQAGQVGRVVREVLCRIEPHQGGVDLAQRSERGADLLFGLGQVAEDAEGRARPRRSRWLSLRHHLA